MSEGQKRVRLPPRISETPLEVVSSGRWRLEGRVHVPEGAEQPRGNAVILHPHPLHGGTFENKVVTSSTRASASAGYATLRFNFRGTGRSEGAYGSGVGEREDVLGAFEALSDHRGMDQEVGIRALIGFSFGSMVACGCLREQLLEVDVAVLIGLPLDGWSIDALSTEMVPAGGLYVIVGEHDEFCSEASAGAWVAGHADDGRVSLEVIEGTDHFFGGRLGALSQSVFRALGGAPERLDSW